MTEKFDKMMGLSDKVIEEIKTHMDIAYTVSLKESHVELERIFKFTRDIEKSLVIPTHDDSSYGVHMAAYYVCQYLCESLQNTALKTYVRQLEVGEKSAKKSKKHTNKYVTLELW